MTATILQHQNLFEHQLDRSPPFFFPQDHNQHQHHQHHQQSQHLIPRAVRPHRLYTRTAPPAVASAIAQQQDGLQRLGRPLEYPKVSDYDLEIGLTDLASASSIAALELDSVPASYPRLPSPSEQGDDQREDEDGAESGGYGHHDDGASSHSLCVSPTPELMQSNPWMLQSAATPQFSSLPTQQQQYHPGQQQQQQRQHGHHRESSASSLGSAGPASPFIQNLANPHIAVTADSIGDGMRDFITPALDSPTMYYSHDFTKSVQSPHDHFAANYGTFVGHHPNQHHYPLPPIGTGATPDLSYAAASPALGQQVHPQQPQQVQGQVQGQPRRSLLPPPDLSARGAARSNPGSVASSVGGDSPATPATGGGGIGEGSLSDDYEYERSRKAASDSVMAIPPKLDRTLSDVYGDELYNPDFQALPTAAMETTTSPRSAQSTSAASRVSNTAFSVGTGADMFGQRLQTANHQHLAVPSTPASASTSRARSPFPPEMFGYEMPSPPSHGPFLQTRGHVKTEPADLCAAVSAATGNSRPISNTAMVPARTLPQTPQTISPKDAMLEYEQGESNSGMYMFAAQQQQQQLELQGPPQLAPRVPVLDGIMVPQQYPFIPHPQSRSAVGESIVTFSPRSADPPHQKEGHRYRHRLEQDTEPALDQQRPQTCSTASEDGTYTCTYHGCTLRFDTQVLLQKHKREGHRQAHGPHPLRHKLGGGLPITATPVSPAGPVGPDGLLNSQSGPHRCDRINPSTNKPCRTVFSRPYDLTRHEDTIHNARKRKVRCDLCSDKTFSRRDALTRHFRVCHPEVELRGRHHRRRLASTGSTNNGTGHVSAAADATTVGDDSLMDTDDA